MNAYKGANEQVNLAFGAVQTEIMAKTVKDGTYDARTSTNASNLKTNVVDKDLKGTEWSVKVQGISDAEANIPSNKRGIIYIEYKNSKIDKGVIDSSTPAEEGYVHYKIYLDRQSARLEEDIDLDNGASFASFTDGGTSSYLNPTPITSITMNQEAASVRIGETVTLSATASPSDTTESIKWVSENTSVATVDQLTGKVTGIAAGTAIIKASNPSGTINADQSCTVTVVPTPSLDSTSETAPWLPAGASPLNNDLATGLTIIDENENEWVWIEVPKSVTKSVTEDVDIESALRTYCSTIMPIGTASDNYRNTTHGNVDIWYDDCGMLQNEYNNTKHAMLNSIKENGGFYIGKYETGIKGTVGATTGARTSEGSTTQEAAIKANLQPYTCVSCSQAENLAKNFAPQGKNTSLLFGIQWDLVLKYIKVKEKKTSDELTYDSTSWGNYSNNSSTQGTFRITSKNAMISSNNGGTWTVIGENTEKSGFGLLTTGSSTDLAPLNIFDLAGNVYELTLEKNSANNYPNTLRGGGYGYVGGSFPASSRVGFQEAPYTSDSKSNGFRVALY